MEKPVTKNFYSIVIPAHNEESYIGPMLESVHALDFPKDQFEVIVVENASTDATLKIAQKTVEDGCAGTVFHIHSTKTKGVSHARNMGADHSSAKSNWLVFIDSDSMVRPQFLKELDHFLSKNRNKNYAGGTPIIHPIEKNRASRFWYWVINLVRKVTKYSWIVQIIRKDVWGGAVRYDESLTFGEDIKIYGEISKRGKIFLLKTNQIESSARRFQKKGWVKVLSSWIFVWAMPYEYQKKSNYNIVR